MENQFKLRIYCSIKYLNIITFLDFFFILLLLLKLMNKHMIYIYNRLVAVVLNSNQQKHI